MSPSDPRDYLETEVMTAAPQKLQLMLIEATIRQAQAAREHWAADNQEKAVESLIRAQQIVTELLCGLNGEHDKELSSKVASVYLFIFRSLVAAQMDRDEDKLDEAVSILEIERETWRQVCIELGTKRATPAPTAQFDSAMPSQTSFQA